MIIDVSKCYCMILYQKMYLVILQIWDTFMILTFGTYSEQLYFLLLIIFFIKSKLNFWDELFWILCFWKTWRTWIWLINVFLCHICWLIWMHWANNLVSNLCLCVCPVYSLKANTLMYGSSLLKGALVLQQQKPVTMSQ